MVDSSLLALSGTCDDSISSGCSLRGSSLRGSSLNIYIICIFHAVRRAVNVLNVSTCILISAQCDIPPELKVWAMPGVNNLERVRGRLCRAGLRSPDACILLYSYYYNYIIQAVRRACAFRARANVGPTD